MARLFQNNPDGARAAARAVFAHLSAHDGIEESWSTEWKRYKAEPEIDRWHNCREQGYVVWMSDDKRRHQINIAFFEHRNSDDICAIAWIGKPSLNPPTLRDIPEGVYDTKWDIAHSVSYDSAYAMADWIFDRLKIFWEHTSDVETNVTELTKLVTA